MPRTQKLKVYRTPIGFHDAYVAAPSQKAALEAWGSDHDLFARGVAERVDDPALIREPLEKPGVVVKRLRGTAEEQIAALPTSEAAPRPARRASSSDTASASDGPPPRRKGVARKAEAELAPPPKTKPKPKPDRVPLERAEQAVGHARARHTAELDALRRREAELARERRQLEQDQESEAARLERDAEKVRQAYERALRVWRG